MNSMLNYYIVLSDLQLLLRPICSTENPPNFSPFLQRYWSEDFCTFFVLFWGEPVSFCLSIICQTSESITSWQGTNRSLSQHRGIKHVFFTVSDQSVKRYKVWEGGLCLPCLTFVYYYQFQWNNDVPEYRGLSCYAMSFLYWFTLQSGSWQRV